MGYARRLVPSVAAASRNKLFAASLDAIDRLVSLPYTEFRNLPPNHLRVRVGTGQRLLFNHYLHLAGAYPLWLQLFAERSVRPDSVVLDIGCGCGRMAQMLRDSYYYGEPIFRGTYIGLDVDAEAIDWCKNHFPVERFNFHAIDMFSSVYNPDGDKKHSDIPVENDSVDFVLCISLFTHLLADDVSYYLKQIHRVLREGGVAHMSFFCIDHLREHLGGVHSFRHRIESAYAESLESPEAAVAYEEEFLVRSIKGLGVADVRVHAADPVRKRGMLQSVLVFKK